MVLILFWIPNKSWQTTFAVYVLDSLTIYFRIFLSLPLKNERVTFLKKIFLRYQKRRIPLSKKRTVLSKHGSII